MEARRSERQVRNRDPPILRLQRLVGRKLRSGTRLSRRKQWGAAREAASSAQSNGSVGSLDRSRSMLWARSATSLAHGAERRGRIERSMHQTWRFKRVNGTAYPDSIASSLRDASGAEVARLEESSNASEPIFATGTGRSLRRGEESWVGSLSGPIVTAWTAG